MICVNLLQKGNKIMTGKCPILFENNQKKYQLTNQEIREFCKLGCSADCDIYLKEYVNELRKRKE